ncbi:transcriptional regulator NrdR [Piscinibacterium candidicorallinum]|jgi:transcriptional repressor NrdR|uniref:Transcriptional repressor NrdR n=1 Tax=Piscinibacterium candidicorallinum TaxID=1793872 RepID=A0ABV7H6Z7_9BURK|nr:NrdR family transcriptional regulator [beta proteobacterium AAP99]
MRCPFCNHDDTAVLETRASDDGTVLRRRRQCPACEKRFTTYERAELSFPLVVKKNGSRVEYDQSKLRASLGLSLRKRPVTAESLEAAIGRIESKLMSSAEKEIPSERLGELVMRELKKLDKVAYIRFASVYKSFEDVDEFADAVLELKPRKDKPGA